MADLLRGCIGRLADIKMGPNFEALAALARAKVVNGTVVDRRLGGARLHRPAANRIDGGSGRNPTELLRIAFQALPGHGALSESVTQGGGATSESQHDEDDNCPEQGKRSIDRVLANENWV